MLGRRRRRARRHAPPAVSRRKGLSRLIRDDRLWRDVSFALYFGRTLQHALGKRSETVSLEKLRPGQSVQITAIPTRRGKGRDRR